VNHTEPIAGKSSAVCYVCERKSRPVALDRDGEPNMWALPRGWSTAPYPAGFKHSDGSTGSTYTCPACNARLRRGETLRRSTNATAVRSV